tara:strand:- start:364 stop:498 length:135 start_codon:yes stop_codon:yes gene_type:complete
MEDISKNNISLVIQEKPKPKEEKPKKYRRPRKRPRVVRKLVAST